ncbi:MAG: DNA primase [Alphaproteobacteria bacterium CG11_big_fil_rev_8_21_14_0_20_44_7]|nr:MAG: DNA primase [Alphaproteobacteria bacterium CG11_big_fil_rev_8_21_14_0_20_44_7]
MLFPREFVEQIKDRINISEVVRRRVNLKQRGNEHSGLCPFHNEKTPSFTVNDEKGFYHCFGCGAHGNLFDFVMRTEGMNFPEAIEKLAFELNMTMPKKDAQAAAKYDRYSELLRCAETACEWFQDNLRKSYGANARDYLKQRGLNPEIIERFKLGFAPDERGALQKHLESKGFSLKDMQEIGLVKNGYEYFRGRVIFTITNSKGQPIAFGGRSLDGSEPKYLNSPETEIFHKRRVLFAKSISRRAAHEKGELIVTEGYMDVISLNQSGFNNAVAPLGTSLSHEHMEELWKICPEPTLCFDGDNAGKNAMIRAANLALPMLKPGFSLKFVQLPKGQDPDDIVRKDAGMFRNLLNSATPLSQKLYESERDKKLVKTPEQQADFNARLVKLAEQIQDKEVSQNYRRYFSESLWNEFKTRKGKDSRTNKSSSRDIGGIAAVDSNELEKLEQLKLALFGIICKNPELLENSSIEEEFMNLEFQTLEIDEVRQDIIENIGINEKNEVNLEELIKSLDGQAKRYIKAGADFSVRHGAAEQAYKVTLEQYRQQIIEAEHANLKGESEDEFLRLQQHFNELISYQEKINASHED